QREPLDHHLVRDADFSALEDRLKGFQQREELHREFPGRRLLGACQAAQEDIPAQVLSLAQGTRGLLKQAIGLQALQKREAHLLCGGLFLRLDRRLWQKKSALYVSQL